MKRIINILIITLLVASPALSKTGKSGWSIFRRARSAKFKPITVTPVMAVRGDLTGVFYNPAILAMNKSKELFFLSELGLTDDIFGGIVYGQPLLKGGIAGGFIYYDAGDIELSWLDSGSLVTKNVKAQKDLLFIGSYGHNLRDNMLVGATLKVATSKIVEREGASAVAVDLGALYIPPVQNLTVTMAVQNLGTSSKFVEKANPLPFSAFVGAGYLYSMPNDYYLAPGCDLTYLFDEERMVPELGFEFGQDPYSVNFGYKINVEEAAWHIGFTYLKDKYDIAYGYLPGIRLDSTHRLSIGYRFN